MKNNKKKIIIFLSFIITISILVVLCFLFKNKIIIKTKKLPDQLSEEQMKIIEESGVDDESTFQDARLPGGESVFEWGCKNDREFIKKNYPDQDKKCIQAGY